MSPAGWILVAVAVVCALSGLLVFRLMRITDAPRPRRPGDPPPKTWPEVERRRRPRNPN